MKRIDSKSNPLYKRIKSLVETRGIKKENLFLVYGQKPIQEMLTHPNARFVLTKQSQADEAHRLQRLSSEIETIFLSNELFEEINLFNIDYPVLVCETVKLTQWDPQSPYPTLLIPFGNPQNLGAALRSAHAFQMDVVLLKESANPFHPKTLRALSGNIFKLRMFTGPSIQEIPQQILERLIVLDQSGKPLHSMALKENSVFLFGEEGQGIPAEVKKARVATIPISKNQESLNAMAALSICAYQYRLKFPL